jgi:hypothetical protein
MTAELIRTAAEKNFRESGTHELSVFASADLDIEGVILAAREHDPRAVPHSRIQVATAAAVRGVGCRLVHDEPPRCHCSLMFSAEPSITDIEALMSVFSEPIGNPFPLSRR